MEYVVMRIIADLQIHSRFARATSKNITLELLEKGARTKGLTLIGTGDFQHPEWRKEIDRALQEDEHGILRSKSGFPFLWQTEVSLMFSQGGKRRAVHVLIFAPTTTIANAITAYLGSKGRLDYDGRPIFGMSCKQLVHDLKKIDDMIEIIPAHAFTPWFGVFGSDSGFDSLAECFEEERRHIYAVESGMSADPGMIWRLQEDVQIVSFSDAHSHHPWRIGREATIFELSSLTYASIIRAIRTGVGIEATIETPPAYGKYHYDGHRACTFSCSPEETRKLKGICPVCHKPLTIGVDYRIEQLAKEPQGYEKHGAKPYYSLVPLHELLAFVYGVSMTSKKIKTIYDSMIDSFGNELAILLNVTETQFNEAKMDKPLIEAILVHRAGKLRIKPGYDGVYGTLLLPETQKKLF